MAFATIEGQDDVTPHAKKPADGVELLSNTYGVFIHDLRTGRTEEANLGPGGVPGRMAAVDGSFSIALSADGRFVAFEDDTSNLVPNDTNDDSDIFLRDRKAGTTVRVSVGPGGVQADGNSGAAAISVDGRFVAFDSDATNLVPHDTNGLGDVFVRIR